MRFKRCHFRIEVGITVKQKTNVMDDLGRSKACKM